MGSQKRFSHTAGVLWLPILYVLMLFLLFPAASIGFAAASPPESADEPDQPTAACAICGIGETPSRYHTTFGKIRLHTSGRAAVRWSRC